MSEQRPLAVGLTGGIGSGKSVVASLLEELGVPVLDLDRVGHEVVASDADVREQLIGQFGTAIVGESGDIDRKQLAASAFVSDEATSRLNAIVHPAIWRREKGWLAAQQAPYAVIEASVLIESGGSGRMDRVVAVLADTALRRQRVLSRDGEMSGARFDAIVARQCDDATRRRFANELIDNNGDLESLRTQVMVLHSKLLAQSGS